MDVDEPLMKEWIVRTDRDAGAYTALPSSIRSYSQTSSMRAKTQPTPNPATRLFFGVFVFGRPRLFLLISLQLFYWS